MLTPKNIEFILVTLPVFHFEISGSNDNFSHRENIELISITLLVFHFEISGNDDNFSHP